MVRHQRPHRRRSKLGTTFKAGRKTGLSMQPWMGTLEQQRMKRIFKKYQNKDSWKNPASATALTHKEAIEIARAFEFFHGTRARLSSITLWVRHKDGLVTMPHDGWLIESTGYAG
jgi:hypothetical protein